jgi:hypothetical protein
MHSVTIPAAGGALLLAMTVPAAGALAAGGSAPLSVHGTPSRSAQLTFPLPDGWSSDLQGPSLNRGVYGRDLPAGDAICQVTAVTRGESRRTGIERTRPLVRVRFGGGRVSFRAIERKSDASWYRSATGVDPGAPAGWTATGVAELPTPRFAGGPARTVVLVRGYAHAFGVDADGTTRAATPDERAQCGEAAPGELARGLRTILGEVEVGRR